MQVNIAIAEPLVLIWQNAYPGDQENANGFVFDGVDESSMDSALDRALKYYRY